MKELGFKTGILTWAATTWKAIIIRFNRKYADYLVSIRKGECKRCGKCCKINCVNKETKDGIVTCKIYDTRYQTDRIGCAYSPFPWDFKFGHPKWRKYCALYYEGKYGVKNDKHDSND